MHHIHGSKSVPLLTCIETKRGDWYYCCSLCLADFEERKQIRQMFRLSEGKPKLKNKICIEQICRDSPLFTAKEKHLHMLFELNIPKMVKQVRQSLISIDLESNLVKIEKVKSDFHEVYAKLKSSINCITEDSTKFGKINEVKIMLEIILELEKMHTVYFGSDFRKKPEYIPYLQQIYSNKLKIADMMNVAEYFLDKFEVKTEEVARELMDCLNSHRMQRKEWLITNK